MSGGRQAGATARLIERLAGAPGTRLVRGEDGWTLGGGGAGRRMRVSDDVARRLLADGLLAGAGPGRLKASAEAAAWLRRRRDGASFAGQHGDMAEARIDDGTGVTEVTINRAESPVTLLAAARGGRKPFLSGAAVEAAERLRRDFEKGRMQPRVTANWSAAVSSGRRAAGGASDIGDAALAARMRVEAAIAAAGPELGGILLDAVCFLKGLETIERERQWPARSAKLVLRLGLQALARHYGLAESARGAAVRPIRSWGGENYRPAIG